MSRFNLSFFSITPNILKKGGGDQATKNRKMKFSKFNVTNLHSNIHVYIEPLPSFRRDFKMGEEFV